MTRTSLLGERFGNGRRGIGRGNPASAILRAGLRSLAVAWLLHGLLWAQDAVADAAGEQLQRVKAAIVLNISRFVSWPAEAFADQDEPVRLCLYRSNPFGAAIGTVRGKSLQGRAVEVTTIASLGDGGACHILFIPASALDRFVAEDGSGPPRPMLILTDLTDLTERPRGRPRSGVHVTLVRDRRRIGFEIDLPAVRRSGLHMSSELLKLARIVDRGP